MQQIHVSPLGPHEYAVRLTEGNDTTDHKVTVSTDLLDDLALDPDDREVEADLVRESMAFLLDRVTADDLDHDIDLEATADEYPDFGSELSARLGLIEPAE